MSVCLGLPAPGSLSNFLCDLPSLAEGKDNESSEHVSPESPVSALHTEIDVPVCRGGTGCRGWRLAQRHQQEGVETGFKARPEARKPMLLPPTLPPLVLITLWLGLLALSSLPPSPPMASPCQGLRPGAAQRRGRVHTERGRET